MCGKGYLTTQVELVIYKALFSPASLIAELTVENKASRELLSPKLMSQHFEMYRDGGTDATPRSASLESHAVHPEASKRRTMSEGKCSRLST